MNIISLVSAFCVKVEDYPSNNSKSILSTYYMSNTVCIYINVIFPQTNYIKIDSYIYFKRTKSSISLDRHLEEVFKSWTYVFHFTSLFWVQHLWEQTSTQNDSAYNNYLKQLDMQLISPCNVSFM